MNETEKKVLRYIRNLRPIILHDGRADGVVTPAESESLVRMMDALLAQGG